MSYYRRIDVRVHGDRRYRALSRPEPCGQHLWLYLLTGPHTAHGLPGLYNVTSSDLAQRLGWAHDAFIEVWQEIEGSGTDDQLPLAIASWDDAVVFVPNVVRYNTPKNSNIVKGWVKHVDLVPECDLKTAWVVATGEYLQTLEDARFTTFDELIWKQFPKQFPKQFREQFQDKTGNSSRIDRDRDRDKDRKKSPAAEPPAPAPEPKQTETIPYEAIIDHLNAATGRSFRSDAMRGKVTRSLIRARWNEGWRLDDFIAVIDGRVKAWASDANMVEYLRPATLFAASKFEGYRESANGGAAAFSASEFRQFANDLDFEYGEGGTEAAAGVIDRAPPQYQAKLKARLGAMEGGV